MEIIPEHSLVFGGDKMIGIVDERKDNCLLQSDYQMHKGTVTDIVRINNHIISGDSVGGIFSWRFFNYD